VSSISIMKVVHIVSVVALGLDRKDAVSCEIDET
jgi:hypothetical protein